MPANKNAMTRYMILDELLSDQYHNYSLNDLTDEVSRRLAEFEPDTDGVVRRTIEKDIDYLEYGPFNVELDRRWMPCVNRETGKTSTKKCLRYADPSFSIFKKQLSDDERHLLREAIALLGQFDGLPNLDSLEKLRLSLEADNDDDRKIISFTKNPLENSNLLGELFTAIAHKQVIELTYHVFSQPDDSRQVIVHPYLLKEYNRRWFLIAAANDTLKLLNFALDRIDSVKLLDEYEYVEPKDDLDERFDDIIGVTLFEENPLLEIIFWVSDRSKDYVITKPIHDSQRHLKGERSDALRAQFPSLTGGEFFRIDCKRNYELIRELLSFGKDLIVLTPSEIRDEISSRLSEMSQIYNTLPKNH